MRFGLTIGFLLLAGMMGGCGGPSSSPQFFPVSGKLLDAEGRAAFKAVVTFHRKGATADEAKPSAQVGSDGVFKLSTFAEGDGAPAGDYAVTIVWPGPPPADLRSDPQEVGPDRLQGRLQNPATSPWKVTVAAGPNELKSFKIPDIFSNGE